MDSFAVCIGKGMCRQHFHVWRAFKIALVFGLFQALMPFVGYVLSIGFSEWIRQFDHWLAFIILAVLGIKMIYECLRPEKKDDCTDCSCKGTEAIDWKNVMTLAFATSIDAAATGLIFASYPGTILQAAVMIGVICFLFSFGGMFLGFRLGKKMNFCLEAVGGVILIGIGLKILLEHLLQ
ncbi:MAG: manganese efflux pump MntP family protein [Porphyromonadaceae bacterium]|nr:manganese efflux pump MntP family protein [Porphyromonadaceae bacterium]